MICVTIALSYNRVLQYESVSQGLESALVAPSSDCTLRDSAAMLSTNSQHIDTSESDPSSSSTAWSDPDVSESQAACQCATLRDTSSSLLLIGPDITRQTMNSQTTICGALLFHSINCEPSRETGGCTHACPSRPSCNHSVLSHARTRCTSMQTDNMRIPRPCVSAFELFF